jgi:hypothetical protein
VIEFSQGSDNRRRVLEEGVVSKTMVVMLKCGLTASRDASDGPISCSKEASRLSRSVKPGASPVLLRLS